MIRELTVRNLAVIENVHLSFGSGFHVLTGETGAGKSILIDAFSLVLGARGSAEFVRHRAKKAEITALFEVAPNHHPLWENLEEIGIEPESDHTLLIKREISYKGKSTCRINGQLVTLSMLKQIGSTLMDLHGQHDQQSLLNEEEHIAWLDAYAGQPLTSRKRTYQQHYQAYKMIEREIHRLSENERQHAQRVDLLQYQVNEISAANLQSGEEDTLQQNRNRLTHLDKLLHHISHAYQSIQTEQQGLDLIGSAITELEKAIKYEPNLEEATELIKSAYFQLEEAATQLGQMSEQMEYDPDKLNEVEARLHQIDQLKRKYGTSIDEILEYAKKAANELSQLQYRESHIDQLQNERKQLRKELIKEAKVLSEHRQKTAKHLEQNVEQVLRDLNMQDTSFQITFITPEDEQDRVFGQNGWDQLRFTISANPGEPVKPLNKIASGGELARIMLALKTIFNQVDQVDCLIFDEIDTGVSGRAAQAIAEKMDRIAAKRQVLVVTHLPQVACMADHHFIVSKHVQADRTITQCHLLHPQQRITELARMLGGVEVTQKTNQHAEEMLRLAKQSKARNHA